MQFLKKLWSRAPSEEPLQTVSEDRPPAVAPVDSAQALRSLCYPNLRYHMQADTNGERQKYANYEGSLPIYIQMVNFAYHCHCRSVLELGAGLSTAVWARLAAATGARVQTVEADLAPMWSYADGSSVAKFIRDYVELYEGATVSWNELTAFYQEPRLSVGKIPVVEFAHHLDQFFRPHPIWDRMNRTSGDRKSQMAELIVDHDGRLHFDEAFLAYFPTLEREKAAIREISGSGSPGLLSTLATGDQTWDFVFFDSGELSSIIEWEILKDRIQIGGLAAFHDIYFPKSIKNFVVCASLLQDSNWKPIFMDESTTQGLLVAQRVQ